MFKIFHRLFDSWRVKDSVTNVVHIGSRHIGTIEFYPSGKNPFIEGHGHVHIYDNGDIFCDEHLVKLVTYTDSHKEFMEFCLDLWKNKTNQKIYPNNIILSSGGHNIMDERRSYRDFEPKNYLVE